VEAGHYYLPGAPTGGRETIVTSPIEARPQWLLQMPWPSWAHFIAALGTAGFFLLLTVKLVVPATVCGVIAVAAVVRWLWGLDPGRTHPPVDIGGGIRLPVYVSGRESQSWWAMVVLMLVSGSIYGCAVFSYLFLWTVQPEPWATAFLLPAAWHPIASGALLVAASLAMFHAGRMLTREASPGLYLALIVAIASLAAAFGLDLAGHLASGLSPSGSGYGAVVYLIVSLNGFYVTIAIAMALFTLARRIAGKLDRVRRVTFENTQLFWQYTVAQSLAGLVVVHLVGRLLT
jgi:cytochrome c oxidase subunit I+III